MLGPLVRARPLPATRHTHGVCGLLDCLCFCLSVWLFCLCVDVCPCLWAPPSLPVRTPLSICVDVAHAGTSGNMPHTHAAHTRIPMLRLAVCSVAGLAIHLAVDTPGQVQHVLRA
jgi:hypothetical protein